MLPLVLGTMMNPLNSTMLITALTTICTHFGRDTGAGALLITPLYIAATIGQPLMGRLADIYNPKAVNRLGFILVFIAGVIGVFAPAFEWLIVSRVILGLGTSAAYPSSMALVTRKYRETGQTVPGEVLGILTVASQVVMILGPVLGGFLTSVMGWYGVFFVNIPWVIVSLYLSKAIPSYPVKKSRKPVSVLNEVDAGGILLFGMFLVSVFITVMKFHWFFLAALIVLLIVFMIYEWKRENPFVDVKFMYFRPRLFEVYLRILFTNYVTYLLLYSMIQWIEVVYEKTPSEAGVLTLPMSVISAVSAMMISKNKNLKKINAAATIFMMITCAGLLVLSGKFPLAVIIGFTVVVGATTGTNMVANQLSLNAEAPSGKTGVSFGLYRTFGYIGAVVSGMQLKTIFSGGITDGSLHSIGLCASVGGVLLVLLYVAKFRGVRAKPDPLKFL